jgi:ribosomal protein L40E
MRQNFRTLANICHGLTVIGGVYAAAILLTSLHNITSEGLPDFSSVITISFVILPYCIGRVFEALAARESIDDSHSLCPACHSIIPDAATKCRYCQSTLNPTD